MVPRSSPAANKIFKINKFPSSELKFPYTANSSIHKALNVAQTAQYKYLRQGTPSACTSASGECRGYIPESRVLCPKVLDLLRRLPLEFVIVGSPFLLAVLVHLPGPQEDGEEEDTRRCAQVCAVSAVVVRCIAGEVLRSVEVESATAREGTRGESDAQSRSLRDRLSFQTSPRYRSHRHASSPRSLERARCQPRCARGPRRGAHCSQLPKHCTKLRS